MNNKRRRRAATEDVRQRILEATRDLIAARGSAGVSVLDICTAADVSVSSLYNLFESKEELLKAVFERVLNQAVERATQEIAQLDIGTMTTESLVELCVRMAINIYVDEMDVITASDAAEREFPELAKWRMNFESEVARRLRDLFIAHIGPEQTPGHHRQVEFVIHVAGIALLRGLTGILPFTEQLDMSKEEFGTELTRLVLAYLNAIRES